jgi:hypothetical protein
MRYTGTEPCTSPNQVIRYLTENYAGPDGAPMPREAAQQIVTAGAADISKGITVFRSNVYYLGDEAVKNHGGGNWTEIPEPDDEADAGEWM